MTNEIDRVITEARGLCWHDFKPYGSPPLQCAKCGEFTSHISAEGNYPSPSTNWQDYGEALEWAQGEEWWGEFVATIMEGWSYNAVPLFMLNPLRGSTALAEFIEANPELFGKEDNSDNLLGDRR